MQNDIIVLKDEDCMHHHIFCSSCHYWFVMSEVGSNYCPHCGQMLFWNSYPKAKKAHETFYELGLKRYKELKENDQETTYNAE